MRRIKLFADAHVMDGEFQGSRTFLREIYKLLSEKQDLEIMLGAHRIDKLQHEFPGTAHIHLIPYDSRSAAGRLLFDIPAIIAKYKIDFAHFQYIAPIRKGCKFIVTTHDVIFNEYPQEFNVIYRKKKNFLYTLSARKADILTTVSAYSKKSIHQYCNIDEEKIHVIPNGVAPHFFEAYNKEEAKKRIKEKCGFDKFILCVSRFEPRKNHAALLRAFLELRLYEQGFHLVLLGSKTIPTPEFDKIWKDLSPSLQPFIVINGQVDDQDIIAYYRAAAVFVYPSRAEGFGIPPLEAAAARIPVLCSKSSSMSDFTFFKDQLFDPRDEEELTRKLSDICRHGLADTILEERALLLQQKYSWTRSADMLHHLIKEKY